MRVTLKNGVTLEFDSTGMAEDFRECDKVARECKCNIIVGGTGICTINMHNSGSSKNIGGREMRRELLEQMLGKKVEVTLVDKTKYTGILRKTRDEAFKNNLNLYLPNNFYFLTDEANQCKSALFRTSYVWKCKAIE